MKLKLYILLVLLFSGRLILAQYSPELSSRVQKVKEASYTDTVRLFDIGKKTIEYGKQNGEPSVEAEVYIYYGNNYFYQLDLDRAEQQYILARKIAESTKRRDLKTMAEIRLAFLKFERGNTLIAQDELKNLLAAARDNNDHVNTVEALNLLGIISETINNSREAVKYYLEGLTLAELHNLSYFPAVFRNNLGLIKLYSGEPKQALADFEKALEIAEKEKNSRLCSNIQMNICMIKVADNNPEQAMEMFARVIDYAKRNNLPRELATNYINLSSAFSNAGRTGEAVQYVDSAIYILKKQELEEELAKAWLAKVSIYIDAKKFKKARPILDTVKRLTEKTHKLEDIASYHLMKYRILENERNTAGALSEYLAYTKIKDSLNEQTNSKVISELQQSYDVQKKEIELERERAKSLLLEESRENERILKWVFMATGIVLIIIFSLLLNNRYVRKLKEKQQVFSNQLIENIDEERKRIAFDLHDDIGQSLSVIKSKIQKPVSGEGGLKEIELALGDVIEQTREISKNLFPSNLEKIGFTRSIAMMMENIQSSAHLVCSFDIAESVETLTMEQKTHLFRIVQECTNNTIKHSGATGLKIQVSEKNREFSFVYQDNGKGINVKEAVNGIGLRSLTERAKMLNGNIDLADEKNVKGFKLVIRFKPLKTSYAITHS